MWQWCTHRHVLGEICVLFDYREDDDSDSGNNVHTYHIPVRFSVSPAVFM